MLQLNILPLTGAKQRKLRETYVAFKAIAAESFQTIQTANTRTYTQLHHLAYAKNKATGVASQLIEEAQRYAWQRRKVASAINQPTVRFDKRLFSFKATGRGNPSSASELTMTGSGCPYVKMEPTAEYRNIGQTVGESRAS